MTLSNQINKKNISIVIRRSLLILRSKQISNFYAIMLNDTRHTGNVAGYFNPIFSNEMIRPLAWAIFKTYRNI
jgi:hypothetical protein